MFLLIIYINIKLDAIGETLKFDFEKSDFLYETFSKISDLVRGQ